MPFERLYGEIDPALLRRQFETALADGTVDLFLALQVAALRTPQIEVTAEMRALGHEFFIPLMRAYRDSHPGRLAIFPGAQAVASFNDGQLNISFSATGGADFDWSDARKLLFRTDAIGELAKIWIHDEGERPFHQLAAYNLATQVLAALQREAWRAVGQPDSTSSETFKAELAVLVPEIERREQLLLEAARQSAETQYARGMLHGGLAVALVSAVVGVAFYLGGVEAIVGVALPAGALGAVISVLQRMHSGGLQLDVKATAGRLRMFGAIRPFIGGVFGMLLFAILEAGQLPAIQVPDATGAGLAFVSLLGFVAGFNERFAQDMLTGTTVPMSSGISPPPM